jgi:Na+-transporting NADH:ubiquinone oxidoreductase subunit C
VKEGIYTVGYMVVVTAVFVGLITAVHLATAERIAQAERAADRAAVLEVLGFDVPEGTGFDEVKRLYDEHVRQTSIPPGGGEGALKLYRGIEDGRTTAYAFPIGGMGFWGPITGLLGVDPTGARTTGITFTQQAETPGLGARITEPKFQKPFYEGIDITRERAPGRWIRIASTGDYEVAAVTGATQTSMRVDAFLNRGITCFRKLVEEYSLPGAGSGEAGSGPGGNVQ